MSVSRFLPAREEVDEALVGKYISTLLPRWTDLMRSTFPDAFIDTELTYRKVKKPLKNFVGSLGKGAIYTENRFFVQLIQAMKADEPKALIHLGMFLKSKGAGHANALLIDKRDRTVSVFEPNGAGFQEFREAGTTLGKFVVQYLSKRGFGSYTLRPSDLVCPYFGVQAREHAAFRARNPKGKSPGYCFVWSLMYMHYHILNPDATHEQVQQAMMKNYSNEELEDRVIRYTDMILKYVAGIKSPFDAEEDKLEKRRCMKFVRYYNKDRDAVLGLPDPMDPEELVSQKNRTQIANQCRTLLSGGDDDDDDYDDDDLVEPDVEELREDLFQFDSPSAAKCIRAVANTKQMDNEVKFDKQGFNPTYLRDNLSSISPKAAALLAKIEELDGRDMVAHGKKFKHFIFSDIKQEGAKFLVGALISRGFVSCFEDNRLSLKSRDEMLESAGENVIYLLSSAVFDKTFTVGLKSSVLKTFNSRPENIQGELARIIVLDSGYKEGIDLFDVKYVHIFEPPTTRANLRQTIGRATRFCGQAGLPFDPKEGWKLSVFLYDVEFSQRVRDVFKISRGGDIIKRFINSDHRVAEFEAELENLCLEVSVDRDLNQFIHQPIVGQEAPATTHENEGMIDPQVVVFERDEDVNLIPSTQPIKISCRAKCGKLRPTRAVPLSTGMFYILAYCLGHHIPSEGNTKLDSRSVRSYLCELLKDAEFCKDLKHLVNNPIANIRFQQNDLTEAFQRGGAFSNLKSTLRSQMLKIVFDAVEGGVVEELERIRVKQRSRKVRNRFVVPQVPGLDRQEVEEIPVAQPPTDKLSHEDLSAYILENFSHCTWPKPKVENQCVIQPQPDAAPPSGPKIVKFTPTQEFIRTYFTPQNPYKGMLIQHGVGCGKTCTAIATATSTFDREGYRILWVTRTSLKSDLYKNMFDLVCNMHVKEMIDAGKPIPTDRLAQLRLLGKAWSIPPMSYKQFSNLVEGKNDLYKKLVKINGEDDPLRKTLIIIDEAHKLYGGDDMTGNERPNLEAFHESLMNSYEVSGAESARVMLMTATPYASNPMEFFQLINLIREREDQLPTAFDDLRDLYLDETGKFTVDGKTRMMNELAGQISYLNRQLDVRQFAQIHAHQLVVNQRRVNHETINREISRLWALERRLRHRRELLETLFKTEGKRKVGRTKAARIAKEASLRRIQLDWENVRGNIETVKTKLQSYYQLQRGTVDPGVDYSVVLEKKCFRKIGKEKQSRRKVISNSNSGMDSGSDISSDEDD